MRNFITYPTFVWTCLFDWIIIGKRNQPTEKATISRFSHFLESYTNHSIFFFFWQITSFFCHLLNCHRPSPTMFWVAHCVICRVCILCLYFIHAKRLSVFVCASLIFFVYFSGYLSLSVVFVLLRYLSLLNVTAIRQEKLHHPLLSHRHFPLIQVQMLGKSIKLPRLVDIVLYVRKSSYPFRTTGKMVLALTTVRYFLTHSNASHWSTQLM